MEQEREIDVKALVGGDKATWDEFCRRYAPAIHGAVRRAFNGGRANPDDLLDASQEVFLRLCRDDFRLLREFDPSRAKLTTWLGVIAHSATIDWLRRKRPSVAIDEVPEAELSVPAVERERVIVPPDLLSARQALILKLIYEREMDVPEIATLLGIDRQTVRSTHHKALQRLRAHFQAPKGDIAAGDGV